MAEENHPEGPGRELESWKEIAAYLKTSVRTVQRWEEQSGLPVKRVMREKRAAIYANTADLDRWLASRTIGDGIGAAKTSEESSNQRSRSWLIVLPIALLVAGIAWTFRPVKQPEEIVARRVTSDLGLESQPAVSPDGQWIAFISQRDDQSAVRVMRLDGTQAIEIAKGADQLYSPQWSSDGKQLAFLQAKTGGRSQVWIYNWPERSGPTVVADALGRPWAETITHSFPALQWNPDGTALLFVDRDPQTGNHLLTQFTLATNQRRTVLEAPQGTRTGGFAVSPLAKQVAIVLQRGNRYQLHVGDLNEEMRLAGALRAVLEGEVSTESPAWLAEQDLVFIRGQREIWRKRPGENPQRINLFGQWPDYAMSSGPGKTLYWGHVQMNTAIGLYDLGQEKIVKHLCDSTTMERRPRLSPDEKEILFNSERDGNLNIWACDLETERVRPISKVNETGTTAAAAEWAPDGATIAYVVNWKDCGELRLASRDGSSIRNLAKGAGDWSNPMWSGDGRRVHYVKGLKGRYGVYSLGLESFDEKWEGEIEGPLEMLLRRDGKYWGLGNGQLALYGPKLQREKVLLEKVTALSGLMPDGLGVQFVRRLSSNISGNYEMYSLDEQGTETRIAKPVPEGMGYIAGPRGYALSVLMSAPSADLFEAGPLR